MEWYVRVHVCVCEGMRWTEWAVCGVFQAVTCHVTFCCQSEKRKHRMHIPAPKMKLPGEQEGCEGL